MNRPDLTQAIVLIRRALADPLVWTGGGALLVLSVIALFAPVLAPHDPNEQDLLNVLLPPMWADAGSADYPLGTDGLGQCVLSRLIYSTRVVVMIAVTAPIGAAVLGCLLALVAGYCGGWIDWLINRVVEVWLSFPAVVLALVLMVALSPGLQNVILAIILVDWTRFCRVLRSEVLSVRRRDFVTASRITGASHLGVIWRDIIPAIVPTVIALMALEVSIAIVAESILSFVGMSAGAGVPTWGVMIADGLNSMYSSPYPLLLPMLCTVLTVLAATFLGQGLRRSIDVRLLEPARGVNA
ncbi:ABC transporter permease [Marinobacter sp. JSM 1782161]|uniref:ABC transporter permease n=1 Tax=Marinobacter sp. JSM 1782161 TaxID=2685906 RepID=UPI0014024B27|nr:ABC transporter permease [Marinobacter sp. JSM 1782161]